MEDLSFNWGFLKFSIVDGYRFYRTDSMEDFQDNFLNLKLGRNGAYAAVLEEKKIYVPPKLADLEKIVDTDLDLVKNDLEKTHSNNLLLGNIPTKAKNGMTIKLDEDVLDLEENFSKNIVKTWLEKVKNDETDDLKALLMGPVNSIFYISEKSQELNLPLLIDILSFEKYNRRKRWNMNAYEQIFGNGFPKPLNPAWSS